MSDLIFEPMQAADVAAIMEIERQSFASPWSAGLFLHELGVEFSRQVVARRRASGPIVGYACWWEVAGEVHVLTVAVDPRKRRHGIGRALVRHILAAGAGAGATVAGLEVRADNAAALSLYAACGFARVGERRDYYGPGEHAVLMDCSIATEWNDRGAGVA